MSLPPLTFTLISQGKLGPQTATSDRWNGALLHMLNDLSRRHIPAAIVCHGYNTVTYNGDWHDVSEECWDMAKKLEALEVV